MSRHGDAGRRGVQKQLALLLFAVSAVMVANDTGCFVGNSLWTWAPALALGVTAQPYRQLAMPTSRPQPLRNRRQMPQIEALETALRQRQQEMYCDPKSVAVFDSIPPGAWKKDFPAGLVLKTAQALSMCARNAEALVMYEHLVLRTRGLAELRELSATIPPSRDTNLVSTAARLLLTQYFVMDDHRSFLKICGSNRAPLQQGQAKSSPIEVRAMPPDSQLEIGNGEQALLSVIEGLVRLGFDQCEYVGAFFDVMAQNFTKACDRLEMLVRRPLTQGGRPKSPATPKEHQVIARHLAFAAMLEKQDRSSGHSCSASRTDANGNHAVDAESNDYGEWQAPEPLPSDLDYRCNIPRVNVENMTPAKFQSEYLLLNKPVIIRNLSRALRWPAHKTWARKPLLEHFGDQRFRVNRGSLIAANKINQVQEAMHMTLREFVEKHMVWRGTAPDHRGADPYHASSDTQELADQDPDFDPMYILDNPGTALRTSGAFPDPFAPWFTPTAPHRESIEGEQAVSSALPPWKNHFNDEERAFQMLFYLGRANRSVTWKMTFLLLNDHCRAPLDSDFVCCSSTHFHRHSNAWNGLFFGAKRWFLFPPVWQQRAFSVFINATSIFCRATQVPACLLL